MTDTPIGARLPDDVLARRTRLPRKPAPVTLSGSRVELKPLDLARDVEPLHAVSNGQPASLGSRTIGFYDPDALIWRYMYRKALCRRGRDGGLPRSLSSATSSRGRRGNPCLSIN